MVVGCWSPKMTTIVMVSLLLVVVFACVVWLWRERSVFHELAKAQMHKLTTVVLMLLSQAGIPIKHPSYCLCQRPIHLQALAGSRHYQALHLKSLRLISASVYHLEPRRLRTVAFAALAASQSDCVGGLSVDGAFLD